MTRMIIDEQLKDRRDQRQAHIHQMETAHGARKARVSASLLRVDNQIKNLTEKRKSAR